MDTNIHSSKQTIDSQKAYLYRYILLTASQGQNSYKFSIAVRNNFILYTSIQKSTIIFYGFTVPDCFLPSLIIRDQQEHT